MDDEYRPLHPKDLIDQPCDSKGLGIYWQTYKGILKALSITESNFRILFFVPPKLQAPAPHYE